MTGDIRDYLVDRFRADAATLRQRAESLTGTSKPTAGPDASVSRAMADACDDVAELALQLPVDASVPEIVSALQALLPKLTALASRVGVTSPPALKAVYHGAATRIQELISAELAASSVTDVSGTDVSGSERDAGEADDEAGEADNDYDDEDDDDPSEHEEDGYRSGWTPDKDDE